MVSSFKTFDVFKYGKMTELTQFKHRFGILAGFTYNIPYQTGFENSTGNTNYEIECFDLLRNKMPIETTYIDYITYILPRFNSVSIN